MVRVPKLVAAAVLCQLLAPLAESQPISYEAIYGTPVDVSIADLFQNSMSYEGRAVRTTGRVDLVFDSGSRGRSYSLRDGFGYGVRIVPLPEITGEFESQGLTFLGQDLQVTGLFQGPRADESLAGAAAPQQTRGAIQFWGYLGPPEKEGKPVEAKLMTLGALVSGAGRREGQTVRVVGKFRGHNLYGDLPVRSQRDSKDWVIKDDVYAVWVTERRPRGDGFSLDPGLKRDTNKWLEVVGRVETRADIVYLKALRVVLAKPPTPASEAQPPPPPPERPKRPPVVVFALPLDGDEVPEVTRFVIQFSKDMDEESFKGRVVLRYAGRVRPGDRALDGAKMSYDGGRRALTVDPGDVLRPARVIELVLLAGIKDLDGMELVPRSGTPGEGTVDVLRYRTEG